MPIYEYECEECGAVSEVLVKNTQAQSEVMCSSCHSAKVTRLISAPGAVMSKSSHAAAPMSCPNMNSCGASCPHKH